LKDQRSINVQRSAQDAQNMSPYIRNPHDPVTSISIPDRFRDQEVRELSGPLTKRKPSEGIQDNLVLPENGFYPDNHHPGSNNPMTNYVKLARTKGARLMRAAETKKRTYLAVLCGENGERVELFTVSWSG
jgi:hypothetical protein